MSLRNSGLPRPACCRHVLRLLLAAFALTIGAGAAALPSDSGQPVHISADSAVQQGDTVTYRGNVVVTQGTLRVQADEVVVDHAAGKVQKIVATGNPAHFQQQPDPNGGLVKATAARLVYYQAENRFELLDNAEVERDGSSVKGNRIEYLPATQTVRAQGSIDNKSGRVEMVLPPAKPQAPAATPVTPTTAPASTSGVTPAPTDQAPTNQAPTSPGPTKSAPSAPAPTTAPAPAGTAAPAPSTTQTTPSQEP